MSGEKSIWNWLSVQYRRKVFRPTVLWLALSHFFKIFLSAVELSSIQCRHSFASCSKSMSIPERSGA